MIRLTTLTKVLTDEAEEKLDRLEAKLLEQDLKNPGMGEEDKWSRMGIQKPDYVEENERGLDSISFEEADFKYEEGVAIIKPSSVDLIVDVLVEEVRYSEVFLDSGKSLTVKHSPEEVQKLIEE